MKAEYEKSMLSHCVLLTSAQSDFTSEGAEVKCIIPGNKEVIIILPKDAPPAPHILLPYKHYIKLILHCAAFNAHKIVSGPESLNGNVAYRVIY